jgi:predicted AlkP superfamily phosphohydrolase/phosphomutase
MTDRVLLVGLDGATYDVLDPLMARGLMPCLQGIVGRGVRATLRSTVPALTPPAWTSLVTGCSPGAHGILDFFRKDEPSTHHFRFLTSADMTCMPVWLMATAAGVRSTVLNFPLTFPPPKILGHIVPGGFMPWRQLRLGCHPPDLFERLKALPTFNPRELALDMAHEAKAIEGCAEEDYEGWIDLHIRRERQWVDIATHLHETEPSELTTVLFDGVDKIQHLCWRFIDYPPDEMPASAWEGRVRDKCAEYFRELDAQIARLLDAFGEDTTVIVASDHGFGPQVRTFFVNGWLEQKGYLAWRDGEGPAAASASNLGLNQLARHVYQLDWTRTRAFAPLPSGNGIHIVRADAGHPGGVHEDEYVAFRTQLARELQDVRDPVSGEEVVTRVWTRDELFAGPHLELAPDLTLELTDGGLVSILGSREGVRRRPFVTGTHRPEGVLLAAGPEIRRGLGLEPRSILDVAPMLLHALGLEIPDTLEGEFLSAAFEAAALAGRPPRFSATSARMAAPLADAPLDAEAEAEIMQRLQALGYVE